MDDPCVGLKNALEIKKNQEIKIIKKTLPGIYPIYKKTKKEIRQSKPSQMCLEVLGQVLAQKYNLKIKIFKYDKSTPRHLPNTKISTRKKSGHPCLL